MSANECEQHCTAEQPAWTVRLQGDIDRIREVFDEFLTKYPLCYAYWRQYAHAERQHAGQPHPVLDRGVVATPYSIDLWLELIQQVSDSGGGSDDVRKCAFLDQH